MTLGCGRNNCSNQMCASNPSFKRLSNNEAAGLAIRLAKQKAPMCNKETQDESKPAKSSKVNDEHSTKTIAGTSTATEHTLIEPDDDDFIDLSEDDNDVIVPSASSSNSRIGSATKNELKSMNDALKEAVKFVTQISQQKQIDKDGFVCKQASPNQKVLYLNERRIENLILKCKKNFDEYKSKIREGNNYIYRYNKHNNTT